jgi:hypothetical protein
VLPFSREILNVHVSDTEIPSSQAPDFSTAFRTLKGCERFLRARQPDYRKALQLLEPFRECHGFHDATADASALVMSLLCATFGDCYRELGEVVSAANWYRRAGGYREGTGFAEYYADMVVKHQLRDHFQVALSSLRASAEQKQTTPALRRAYYNVVSIWKCWSAWHMSQQTDRLIRILGESIGSPE